MKVLIGAVETPVERTGRSFQTVEPPPAQAARWVGYLDWPTPAVGGAWRHCVAEPPDTFVRAEFCGPGEDYPVPGAGVSTYLLATVRPGTVDHLVAEHAFEPCPADPTRLVTFMDAVRAGIATEAHVDDWVTRWHELPPTSLGSVVGLAGFLGLSWESYQHWVERPESLAALVAAERPHPSPTL